MKNVKDWCILFSHFSQDIIHLSPYQSYLNPFIMAPHVEDLRKVAFDAEKDLNSYQAKQGLGKKSDSS